MLNITFWVHNEIVEKNLLLFLNKLFLVEKCLSFFKIYFLIFVYYNLVAKIFIYLLFRFRVRNERNP